MQSSKKSIDEEVGPEDEYNNSGYKTSNRFNLVTFMNTRSVSKGFSNRKIAFYT